MEKRQDLILGLLFAGVGLTAAWLARSYSGAGGLYPLTLGLILALLGVVIAARAARKVADKERQLVDAPLNLIYATVAAIVYVGMVVQLGFYTASALLLLLLPVLLGFRRPVYLAVMALVFISIVYGLFSIVLEKPLPAELLSSLGSGAT